LRADNASREISWDAGKKDEKAVMDTAKISQILYTAMINRKVNRDKIYSSIEPLMPASLTSNVRFVNDVKNDISELKQESAAVPKSVYASLSSAKPAPIEEVTFKVEYTGIPLIFKHLDESLLKSQIESFIYAIIFIYILLVLQLRSFVGAFFGLSPILMIVALMFGVMGLTGIPLDIATVLAASVALGIGIDYSIHFSIRFRNNYRSIPDHLKALDLTLNTTGKAIAINVLAVTMGFLTLLFGQLVPLSRLGILVAITMVGSGLGALTLLPSLFMVTKGRFIENLGRMKSGGIKKEAKKQQKEKQK
jgi:predicted RND superfamily exporter protein